MTDHHRDEFEAWIARDCGDLSTFGSGKNMHYRNSAVNNAWTGWQESRRTYRASLENGGPESAVSEGSSAPLRPVEGVDHISVRKAVLEEAAQVCDQRSLENWGHSAAECEAQDCADDIRKLATQTPGCRGTACGTTGEKP